MGKFYRGGTLISADTFSPIGHRTLGAATEATLWEGTFSFRPSPGGVQVEVVSTSADDDDASTGVKRVRLDYLDASGVRQSEDIVLTGLVAAASVAVDVAKIVAVSAIRVGSGQGAAGTISVQGVGGGMQYEVIVAGRCEATPGSYTVPAGQRAWITALHVSAGASATTCRLKSDTNQSTGAIVANGQFVWHVAIAGTGPAKIDPALPLGPFPAGAKIWVTGINAAGTDCQAQIEGYLEPSAAS